MDISTAGSVCQRVGEKQMFLIAAGDNFHGRAITDISLMRCSFTRDMSLCNRFSIEQLQKYIPLGFQQEKYGITLLPIHELLFKELEDDTGDHANRNVMHSLSAHQKRDVIY